MGTTFSFNEHERGIKTTWSSVNADNSDIFINKQTNKRLFCPISYIHIHTNKQKVYIIYYNKYIITNITTIFL